VWQWLSDDFQPLPGFRTHRLYEDFSKPWFGEHHKMLLGGSWASTGATASQFYRLWFRPGFLQHAGFRMAW
jgi:formylglycine-generating enzyme required for sulfatase activity